MKRNKVVYLLLNMEYCIKNLLTLHAFVHERTIFRKLVLSLMTFELIALSTCQTSCYNSLGNPTVCIPGPQNLVRHRNIKVSPGFTCGTPPSGYCEPGLDSRCYSCNASSAALSHGPQFMSDNEVPPRYWPFRKPTWWQSITWWDASVRGKLTNGILKVNLTLSLNKTFDITGKFSITFYSSQPRAATLLKSSDFGHTWQPYRYFADNCKKRFGEGISEQFDATNPQKPYCKKKPVAAEKGSIFEFEPAYKTSTFWMQKVQDYLKATDILFRLEYPWTDGNEQTGAQNFLNRYYYDVADVRVDGRCHCNGHASYCIGSMDRLRCECKHNTEGIDCERCKPLYNNKPWKAAESESIPNPCEKCTCNNHAAVCVYNATLGYGTCLNCMSNTTGSRCQFCKDRFYRNPSVKEDSSLTCLPCACFLLGVINNGSCAQTSSPKVVAGQCQCKPNIHGRACDQCRDGYYGLRLKPEGVCHECNCSVLGTQNNSIICNQENGQCHCKKTVVGILCDTCKTGYFAFPTTANGECAMCSCDIGGANDEICLKHNGTCLCRHGITGMNCTKPKPGFFFPTFDQLKFEAEDSRGTFRKIVLQGNDFTGSGFARLGSNGSLAFNFTPPYSSRFYIIVRVNTSTTETAVRVAIQNISSSDPFASFTLNVTNSTGRAALHSTSSLLLSKLRTYTITMTLFGPTYANVTMDIDSIVVMPNISFTKSYMLASESEKQSVLDCWNIRRSVVISENQACKKYAFQTLVELQNGANACQCSPQGAVNRSCIAYGGQCYCKPGVGGRKCDICLPGYYNLTNYGCQACSCENVGSVTFDCDKASGQCQCKDNVIGRQCRDCKFGFYGIDSGSGCTNCSCNLYGSLTPQCNKNGRCPCKNTTEGIKCGSCKKNHFNFSTTGCSPCDCNPGGSLTLQCETKQCLCKRNARGEKCDRCLTGTFGVNLKNPYGCQRCFCFNHISNCNFHQNAFPSNKTWYFRDGLGNWKVRSDPNGTTFYTTELGLRMNLSPGITKLIAPGAFLGFQLYSYSQSMVLDLQSRNSEPVAFNITLDLISNVTNTSTRFKDTSPLNFSRRRIMIHESTSLGTDSGLRVQSILSSLSALHISILTNQYINLTVRFVTLETARTLDQTTGIGSVRNVENCSCPANYTGNSCQECAEGYTRATPYGNKFQRCVLCNCSGRSRTCYPQNGKCRNCRLGTEGDHCERCQRGVQRPNCMKCMPGYYGFNDQKFPGCLACNCNLRNTIAGNTSICDPITGQCSCLPNVKGRKCDKCIENAVNISGTCQACSECHRLLHEEILLLRKRLGSLTELLMNVTRFSSDSAIPPSLFGNQLNIVKREVNNLVFKATQSIRIESELDRKLNILNDTLYSLQRILNEVTSVKTKSATTHVHLAEKSIQLSNSSINEIYGILWGGKYIIDTELTLSTNSSHSSLLQLRNLSTNMESLLISLKRHWNTTLTDAKSLVNLNTRTLNISQSGVKHMNIAKNTMEHVARNISSLNETLINAKQLSEVLLNNVTKLQRSLAKVLNDTVELLTTLHNYTGISNESMITLRNNITILKENIQRNFNESENVQRLSSDLTDQLRSLNASANIQKSKIGRHNTEALRQLNRVRVAQSNASNAIHLSKRIVKSMEDTLQMVKNFNQAVTETTAESAQTTKMTNEVNRSRVDILDFALKLKSQVKLAMDLSDTSLKEIKNSYLITRNISADVMSLSRDAKALQQNESLLKYSSSYADNRRYNVSKIKNKTIGEITGTCRKVSFLSWQASESGERNLALAKNTSKEVNIVNGTLRKVIVQFQSISHLDDSSLEKLSTRLKNHQLNFSSSGVTAMTASLRTTLLKQREDLKTYKAKVEIMKDEIRTLKELINSLSTTKGCG